MTTLTSFIADIATNPALQAKFALTPQTVMTEYGLTATEIGAVLQGNKEKIESLTGNVNSSIKYMFIDAPNTLTH